MGTRECKLTGICLSTVVALLGAGTALLLSFAGTYVIDLFYTDSRNLIEHNRITHRMPYDNWYDEMVLNGWALGFIYIVPGFTGITASLFFKKCLVVIHLAIAMLALFIGSFLHTGVGLAILYYRMFVLKGATMYNPWLEECMFVRDNAVNPQKFDERCITGRHAVLLSFSSMGVALVAWILLMSHVGFMFHAIGKNSFNKNKKSVSDRNNQQTLSSMTSNSPTASTSVIQIDMPSDSDDNKEPKTQTSVSGDENGTRTTETLSSRGTEDIRESDKQETESQGQTKTDLASQIGKTSSQGESSQHYENTGVDIDLDNEEQQQADA